MADTSIQYKVIILYMLDKADFPLTNGQISDLILEKEYTNYFTLQQTINELEHSNLIRTETSHNATRYRITPDGKQALHFFSDKVSDAIKADIAAFFKEKSIDLRQETSIVADYFRQSGTSYGVRCLLRNNTAAIFELNFSVNGKEQAEAACSNWKAKSDEVFAYLMDMLIS